MSLGYVDGRPLELGRVIRAISGHYSNEHYE